MSVTTVVPTYRRPELLARAIESLLAQEVDGHEILVLDDVSGDATERVVRGFADPRVTYVARAERMGFCGNWIDGIGRASRPFISFLMDDDLIAPGFLRRRLEVFDADPGLAAVYAGYALVDPDGAPVPSAERTAPAVGELAGEALLRAALGRTWFVGTGLYRAEVLQSAAPRAGRDGVSADYGLIVRVALARGIRARVLPGSDYLMTEHAGQISVARRGEIFAGSSELLERVLREEDPAPAAREAVREELASWHALWGRALAAEGDHGGAIGRYRRSLRLRPGVAWTWRLLAASAARRVVGARGGGPAA